jgi:hypothetical protein
MINSALYQLDLLNGKIGAKKILKCVLCNLNKDPKSASSKHVLLSFSGFLSQTDLSEDGWSILRDIVEPHGVSLFDVKWESIKESDIALALAQSFGKFAL